jgi:hypothetical protein
MPNPPCQFEDGKTAVFIGTNLENGDTVTTCLEHMVEFFANTLEGLATAAQSPSDNGHVEITNADIDTHEEAVLTEEFQAWLDANTERIQELVETGSTFEEAVEQLLEYDAKTADSTDPDSTDSK